MKTAAPVERSGTVSRRTFLATSAAAGGALVVGIALRGRIPSLLRENAKDPFNAWIQIHPDGQIQLVLNKSEMGQGVFTALPMILAEEAEIDFSRITVVQADNADGTGGSGSVWESYQPLRRAGAQVRQVLLSAAAQRWSVVRPLMTNGLLGGIVAHSSQSTQRWQRDLRRHRQTPEEAALSTG